MKRLKIKGCFIFLKLLRILLDAGEGGVESGVRGKEIQLFLRETAWHGLDVWGS